MTFKIIGTTLLAAGACGSAAAWSHFHNSQVAVAHVHSPGERFSRGEHGERNFDRASIARRRRGAARAWDDRGR
jgi:hypothetical protein